MSGSGTRESGKVSATIQDPACGMMVDEATALRAGRNGDTFYFAVKTAAGNFSPTTRSTKSYTTGITSTRRTTSTTANR